jgi:hypothetical protein
MIKEKMQLWKKKCLLKICCTAPSILSGAEGQEREKEGEAKLLNKDKN